jgi:hypothetical protein
MTKEWFISTGFHRRRGGGYWHALVALRWRWRFDFVKPISKPGYRRIYIGPIEIEWSWL